MEKTYTLELSKAELFLILEALRGSIIIYSGFTNTSQEICDSLAEKIVKAGEDA